jgi:hypothetical protein
MNDESLVDMERELKQALVEIILLNSSLKRLEEEKADILSDFIRSSQGHANEVSRLRSNLGKAVELLGRARGYVPKRTETAQLVEAFFANLGGGGHE